MIRLSVGRRAALVGVVAVAAALVAGWFYLRPGPRPPEEEDDGIVGFRESARDAGITFKMQFLPEEQGENFKINLYDHGCGVAVGDFDGDGHEDVYFTNQLGPNALYRNKGDGTFEDVTARAGVALGDRVCVAATFADYDNDGKLDLFVTSTRGGNVLFRNLGGGKFQNVTQAAGVGLVAHSQTAVFFDYDNDGKLDLFVTNTAQWTAEEKDRAARYYPGVPDLFMMILAPRETNVLYHNHGDGTFTDVTEKAGLAGKGWGGDVAVFDYDEDGRLDLLVTNMFGASQLYRNEGRGQFREVTREVLGKTSWGAVGSRVFDFNNDGHLDLFIVDMHSDMWVDSDDPLDSRTRGFDPRKKFTAISGPKALMNKATEDRFLQLFKAKKDEVVFGNTFFKWRDASRYEEMSDRVNLETFWPWGVAVGDFDNDGFEDLFLPSGMGFPFPYWPNQLMMNRGNETFVNRARSAGIEPPPGGIYLPEPIGKKKAARGSRTAAVADFDGDGRLDLVVNNFNDHPYYFRNVYPQRNFIAFQLTGTRSNRDAVGAVARLTVGKQVLTRQVLPAGGYLSHSSRRLHFGLGDVGAVDRVEIVWPSGLRQKVDHPRINTLHSLTEPREE